MEFLLAIPSDIVFDIAILLDRYDAFLDIASIVKKLNTPETLLKVRRLLTKYTKLKDIYYGDVQSEYTEQWKLDDYLHREDDLPAIIYAPNYMIWFRFGKMHRDGDNPAVIQGDTFHWYKEGTVHRDGDNPAIIDIHKTKYWYKNNKKHRDGGLPALVMKNGYTERWENGYYIGK